MKNWQSLEKEINFEVVTPSAITLRVYYVDVHLRPRVV